MKNGQREKAENRDKSFLWQQAKGLLTFTDNWKSTWYVSCTVRWVLPELFRLTRLALHYVHSSISTISCISAPGLLSDFRPLELSVILWITWVEIETNVNMLFVTQQRIYFLMGTPH